VPENVAFVCLVGRLTAELGARSARRLARIGDGDGRYSVLFDLHGLEGDGGGAIAPAG